MPNDLLASSVPQGPKDLLADQSPPKDVLANPPSSAALPSAPPAIANVGGATVTPKINLSPDIAHPLGRLEAIAQDPGYQAATAYDKAAQAYTANPEQYRQDTLEPVTVPAKTVNVDWEVPPRDDIGTRLQGPPALHSYPIQVPEQRKSALFSTPSTATDYNAVESPLNKVAREAYAKTGDVRYLQHAAMTETFNKPGPGVNIPGVKPETSGHLYMELGEEDLPPNFKRAAEQNAAAIQDPNNVGLQVPHPWILQGPNGKYAVRRGEARDQYIQWWEKQKKIGGAEQKMSAEDQAAALDQRRRDNQYDQTPYPGALRAALQPEEQGDVERAKAQLLGLPRPENTGAEDFLNLPGYVGGKAKSATAGVLGAASHILPKLQVNPLYGQPKQDPGLRAANEALGESARKTLEANPVDSKTGKFIGAIPDIAGAVGATYFGGPAGAAAYGAALSGGNTYQSAFEDVYGKARHEGLDDQAAKNLAHAKAFGPAMVSAATGAVLQQLRLPPIVNLPSVVRGGVRYAIENGVERAMTSQEVWAYHIEEAVRHTLAGGTIGGLQDAIDQAAKHVGYNKPIDAQEILDSAIDNAAISAATHLTARAFGEMPKPEQQGDPNAPAAFQGATPGAGPGPQPGQPGAGARTTPPPSGGRYGAKARAKAVRPEENSARETLGIPLNEELNQETVAQYVREAVMRKGVHPDRGGTTQTFQTVWDAGQYLKGRYKGVAGEANARPQAEQPAQEAQPNTRTQQAPPPAAEPVTPEAAAPQPEPPKPQAESVQTASTGDDQRKDGLDGLSTPELRRRARDAGFDPRSKREALIAALRGETKTAAETKPIVTPEAAPTQEAPDIVAQAEAAVREAGKGSVSVLQRKLNIGYGKAAQLLDELTTRGVLRPIKEGAAYREVIEPKEAPSEQQPETVAKPAPTAQENAPAQTPPLDSPVEGTAPGGEGGAVGKPFKTAKGFEGTLQVSSHENGGLWVDVHSKDGKHVASALAYPNDEGGKWSVAQIAVDEDMRRKGIATAIYDEIEKQGGPLEPAGLTGGKMSSEAQRFWASRSKATPDRFTPAEVRAAGVPDEVVKKIQESQQQPSREDIASGKALGDSLTKKVDEWIAMGTRNGQLDTSWERGAVKRLVDAEFGGLTKGSHGGKLAAAKIAVGKAKTFDDLKRALAKITGVPNAAPQGIESQSHQPEHQGDGESGAPTRAGGSRSDAVGGKAEGAAGEQPVIEEIGHEGKFILVKAPKDTRSIFDADGLGGRYFAPRGGYLFPAKRRSEVQAEIERHYGPKAEKPTKAAPTTLEGLPIEDPDALESLKSIGRTPSESDRINAEMRGQGPKVGDVIPWAKGDRSATVLKVEQGGAGLNPWAKQIDFYTVEVAQHSLHLPGTSGGLAKKIDNLTVNDLMKQGWKPTTTAPENSNPPAAKADTIKPEATDESPSNTPRSSDKNGQPAPVAVRGDGNRPLDEASAEDGGTVAGGKVPAAGSDRGAGGDKEPVRGDGGKRGASGRGDGTGDKRLDQAGEPRTADDAGRAGGKGEPDRGVSKPPAESGKADEEQANPALADNHTITDSEGLHKGGLKQRFRDNVKAITLAREILGEGRTPTPAEQAALAKYSGWGAMPGAFNPNTDTAGAWEKEAEEIKGLLSDEEFSAAAKSTLNAHYTSGPIVDGLWSMARRLGFQKGRILEPSLGIGNFFGLMPLDMRGKSQLTGIELDNITGMIAKLLYPRANVQVKGFEEFNAPDGFFDLAISNFPFGDYRVHDKDYSKYAANIHDYFFLKSLDKVRPGGLVVAITSTGTMDKLDPRIRKAINERGELVSAIRLPGETFGKTAGTAVVTDILLLRRRGGEQEKEGPKWMEVVNVPDPGGGEDIPVNEYFANNPEQIIGTLDRSGTMYRGDSKNVTRGDDFEQKFAEAIDRLPTEIYTHVDRKASPKVKINPDDMKLGGYHTEGGKLFRNTKAGLEEVEGATPAQIKLINDHLAVRDALRDVYNAQLENGTKADTDAKRKALNKAYDGFVKRNGPLHKQANIRAFANDPDSPTILAIENWNQKTKTATKADVFRQNTVRGYEKPTKAENASSALGISLNETGGVDIDRIAGLLSEDPETVGEDLVRAGIAFENPAGGWESAEQYLSGEVRMKLLQAKEAAKAEAKYKPNVTALEAVQPADVEAPDIDVKLGVPWVPVESIVDFAAHLLDGEASHFDARYLPTAAKWFFEYSSRGVQRHGRGVQDTELYGTPYAPFPEVMDAALNATPITIRRKDADGNSYVDQTLTADANAKVEAVKALFKEWIWQDDDRREKLARLYNDTFNNVVPVKYNGSHLTFPGMAPFWSQRLRDHQRNAVWRTIVHGSALYAHEVGTGKTATMVASAMELRRLGLARKPAIIALKANIEGVVSDAREIYPGAKILYVEKFDKDNRKRTIAKIASGDWDLVVMTHDNLNMLPMKKEVEVNFINREIEELENVMRSVKGDGDDAPRRGGRSKSENKLVKQLEKAKARLLARLKEALDAPRDDAVTFEETGIDMMFVDEAHKYKSLPVYSKHQRIKGIPQSSNRSDRATMMAMRTQWLQELQNGRGVVFATGTPIANSMAELYTNQRYLQPLELQRRGVYAFDAWAANFGNLNTRLEFNVVGGMQPVTRFSEFVNMRNLKQIAGQMMDVQRAKNMPGFKRPTRKDHAHSIPMTAAQKSYLSSLVRRAEIAKRKRPGDPGDNMLSISMDGRKSALDMRMVDPGADADPNSKLSRAVDKALQIHRDNPGKTQMIFLDLGVNPTDWGFSAYESIINGLVEGGVPREKIIDFAHLTDADKRGAVKRLNSGDALFGIGGSEKMGTGVNAQKLLIALHHLDAPWKPADLEQRDGRGWRSGNENKEVQIHRYVTTGSFDQFMWQTVVSKHRYITSFMESDEFANSLREEGDEGELSYSQIMAIASGKPALIEKVNVDRDVQNLQEAQRRHERGQMKLRDAARSLERRIEETTVLADALKKDIATSNAAGEDFALTLDGKTYTDRDEADKAMGEYRSQLYKNPRGKVVGEYRGLKLIASADENNEHVYLEGATQHHARWNLSSIAYAGRASQMENRLDKINEEIKGKRADLAKTKSQTGTQFTGGGELARKQERLKYLTDKVSDTPVPRESGETVGQSMQKAQADGKTVDEWREANPATAAQVGQNGALVDHIWKYLEKGEGGHTATGPDGKSVDLTDIPMYEEPSYLRPEQEPETAGAKLNTSAKPFYSKLQRVIADKMPAKATPDQVRALVTNAAVKADELKWSGLDDYLKDKTGPVTKAEVEEYLRENDVKVEEVMKGQKLPPMKWEPVGNNGAIEAGQGGKYRITPLPGGRFLLHNRLAGFSDTHASLDEAKGAAQEQLEEYGGGTVPTKFSQYQLPGGKNYRELLLTLPVSKSGDDRQVAIQNKYAQHLYDLDYAELDDDQKSRVDEMSKNDARMRATKSADNPDVFRSGHWDEPNVLAHVRFSDRTDADGKKILHVEEVQSDWHQQGREKGYKGDGLSEADEARYTQLLHKGSLRRNSAEDSEFAKLHDRKHGNGQIPPAPFAKTWPELAMKRMLRYAAENGYDKLAWTPGEIQNERYDLSKQVDNIQWWPKSGNGDTGVLFAYKGGREVIEGERMTSKELADHVGKELAERLLAAPDQESEEGAVYQSLEGKELSIGGSGMKGFYDKILPDFLNKYSRQLERSGRALQEKTPQGKAAVLYEGGASLRAIAKDLGVDHKTVSAWLDKAGIVRREYRRDQLLKAEAVRLYKEGDTQSTVAEKLGVSQASVGHWLKEFGEQSTRNKQYDDDLKAQIKHLYTQEGLSAVEVGEKLDVPAATAMKILREAGVTRSTSEAATNRLLTKPESYKNSSRGKSSPFLSDKTGKWEWADSKLELSRMVQLDEDPEVKSWTKKTERVPYGDGKNYVPDFKVEYADGRTIYEEVKPSHLVADEVVQEKAAAAKAHFGGKGSEYRMVTEDDIGKERYSNIDDTIAALGKKWGARVGETRVGSTPKLDLRIEENGNRFYLAFPDGQYTSDGPWRTRSEAASALEEHANDPHFAAGQGTTLPSIDITPAMRKSVMEEGQPLFQTQAGTIPAKDTNGQEETPQTPLARLSVAGAGLPDHIRSQYQGVIQANAPGATVTESADGWTVTRPDGRTLKVRLVAPESIPVPRQGFAESVASHLGGTVIELPDGSPFRVPKTVEGILALSPSEYARLRTGVTIGGAYYNREILLNRDGHNQGVDLSRVVNEEFFHASVEQDLTDAERTALVNEYGNEELAYHGAVNDTPGGRVLHKLRSGEAFTRSSGLADSGDDAKLSVLAKVVAKPIKFTGEVAKTIMQAVNWYSEPLVERIEKQAGLMGKRTATTARHANDYARRVVGELNQKMVTALDYVSGKHKQGRKAVRELRQVRMVTTPDVTYGYSVFQSAVEAQQPPGLGPLTLTRAADKAVKNQRALVMASGDIMVRDGWKVVDASGKVRPFVPVKDGKRMLRSYTPEYWDAVSRPDFDPMKIAIAKAFGHANGKPWQDMMKEMNDSYDPATKKNAAGGEILRTMKYSPTHVTHPDTGRVIQIMHSEPFDAAAMLVRNFSLRAGYIKHFGQDLPGQDVTNSLIEAFRKNGGNGDDIKNLIKTFHGIPLDPIHMVSPGTFMYQVVRGFRGVYALSKSGALGLAAVPNLFETLTKTLAMTGVENYARAWATILAHPVLAPRALADLGARTVDIQNWMGRKGHTLEMMVKNISYMMTVPLKLANELNELQSAAAGATFAADLPNSGPNSRNAATLRLLGYNEDEIRDLTSANPPTNLLATVPARIAEQTQGTTSRPSELPNSSHSRVFRTILPFQHWPAMTLNRVLKMVQAIAKPGISARQRAHHARILGSMFSGSLLAGTMALLLMAYLRGGKDEVAVKYAEGMDEPTHAAYDALKFSVLGGLATTLGESLFDNHDTRIIGPLLNASMPESMLEEFYKATKGVGPYKGETPLERFNTFIGKRVAVAPSIATAMAAWGLGDKNVKLDVALRAYYRWRKQNPSEKGESGPDVTGPDGEAFKFTRAMRHYMDAAQRGDDEKALQALSDALDVKAEEVGKGASEAVAAAIRSRQILAHLSSEEQEKLGKHIGRDAYDRLEEYDMVLEGWARMMKPQAKPHAPHPKRR